MKVWTYGEARDKILLDCDLQDDESGREFVTPNELVGYFNEAIDEAEAEIHKLHEDYFLAPGTISLVSGTADYALPTDIYANKIRSVMYVNGTDVYEVLRVTNLRKFREVELANVSATGTEDLRYILVNTSSTAGFKIRFLPTPQVTGSYIHLWYLRNAQRIPLEGEAKPTTGTYTQAEVDAFKIDIPEFVTFVLQFVKCKVMAKEGDPRLDTELAILQAQRKLMTDTLTQMVPDDHDEIPADYSHYDDHL